MKKLLLAVAVAAITLTGATAQEPVGNTEAALPRYTLDVSTADLLTIVAGLNELQKKIADPVINRMAAQINEQNAAALKAKAPPGTGGSPNAGGAGGPAAK